MVKHCTKKLIIDLTPEDHLEIKRRAVVKGWTIKKYVLKAIAHQIKTDNHTETLKVQHDKE